MAKASVKDGSSWCDDLFKKSPFSDPEIFSKDLLWDYPSAPTFGAGSVVKNALSQQNAVQESFNFVNLNPIIGSSGSQLGSSCDRLWSLSSVET